MFSFEGKPFRGILNNAGKVASVKVVMVIMTVYVNSLQAKTAFFALKNFHNQLKVDRKNEAISKETAEAV